MVMASFQKASFSSQGILINQLGHRGNDEFLLVPVWNAARGSKTQSHSHAELRLYYLILIHSVEGNPLVATLGLEVGIRGEKPENRERAEHDRWANRPPNFDAKSLMTR
jgi:hypothetical protein